MEKRLKPYGFLRCHASYLVNRRFIRSVGAQSLVLTNGREIPISQRRRREFMDGIFEWYGSWGEHMMMNLSSGVSFIGEAFLTVYFFREVQNKSRIDAGSAVLLILAVVT